MPAAIIAIEGIFQKRDTNVAVRPITPAAIPQAITIPRSQPRTNREIHQPSIPTPPATRVPNMRVWFRIANPAAIISAPTYCIAASVSIRRSGVAGKLIPKRVVINSPISTPMTTPLVAMATFSSRALAVT